MTKWNINSYKKLMISPSPSSKNVFNVYCLSLIILIVLKALDTFFNCQRPVFSLGVAKRVHKSVNIWQTAPDYCIFRPRYECIIYCLNFLLSKNELYTSNN